MFIVKSGFVAFLLWLCGLVGLCGLHRFYVGRTGSGLLWLLTLGLLGIGQLYDLFFLGKMVREANMMAGLAGVSASATANNHNVFAPVINVQVPQYTHKNDSPTG